MNKAALLSTLTAALALGSTGAQPQTHVLAVWADKHLPTLTEKAQALARPPFAWHEVTDLIDATVKAAQDLKGRLPGQDRKAAVKAVVRYAVNTYARPFMGLYGLLLTDQVLDNLVEFAYRRLFGEEAQASQPGVTNAVVYTPAPPADGKTPTTAADFGPSMADVPPGER